MEEIKGQGRTSKGRRSINRLKSAFFLHPPASATTAFLSSGGSSAQRLHTHPWNSLPTSSASRREGLSPLPRLASLPAVSSSEPPSSPGQISALTQSPP